MDPLANVDRNHLRRDGRKFTCTICGFRCYQYRRFDWHSELRHGCRFCGLIFQNLNNHNCPLRIIGGRGHIRPGPFAPQNIQNPSFQFVGQVHQGTVVQYKHTFVRSFVTIESGVVHVYDDLFNLIHLILQHFRSVKMLFKLQVRMIENSQQQERQIPTSSPYITVLHENFIESCIVFGVDFVINTINLFCENDSGFSVDGLTSLEVEFAQLRQVNARGYIPIPKSLATRQGLLNIKTSWNNCFMVSVLAHFFRNLITLSKYPKLKYKDMNKAQRYNLKLRQQNPLHYYEFQNRAKNVLKIDFEGFEEEVTITDIDDFEEQNKHVSVNVFGYNDTTFSPIRLTHRDVAHHINLFLHKSSTLPPSEHLSKWGNHPPEYHFILITDLGLLLSRGRSKKSEFCKWCLKPFKLGSSHVTKCREMVETKLKCYEEGTKFNFRGMHMKFDVMFRVYFDLEAFNVKYHTAAPEVKPNQLSYTRAESNFVVAAFGLSLVCSTGSIMYQRYYCEGVNVMEEFFKTLFDIQERLNDFYKENILPCEPTEDEIKMFKSATHCYECKNEFTMNNHKVQHHHHYLKDHPVIPLCNSCNLLIQHRNIIPVIAHWGTGFDFLFVIKSLTAELQQSVRIIAKNGEQFMALSIGNLQFLDSCQFLNASLEKLVVRLKDNGSASERKRFKAFRDGFDNHQYVDMLTEKQYFPYEWLDGPSKLNCTALPSHADFYNKLNDENITLKEYKHAQLVWKRFKCKTFKDYLSLYLKTDVLLLQVVFENFISTCYKIYGLSPIFSYSLPGYAYHCAMYYEKQDWEFLSDIPMVQMIKENVRGGMCFVTKRRSTACTESLGDVITDNSTRKELLYCDFTNLYGSQMLAPMPHSKYRWLSAEDINAIDILSLPEDQGEGWIFEVDMVYDEKLHDVHNDMPLAPHKVTVNKKDLSPHQLHLLSLYSENLKNPMGGEKLLLTFHKKEKQAVYYKLLKFYISHGLQISRIHRVCTFVEKPIFRNFINKNIQLRQKSNDEFSRSLYKLMINSIYGKVLNIRPNTITRFCNSRVDALKNLADHNFKALKIINDDVSIFFLEGGYTLVNKPYLCGFVTLELSKLLMYKTYYDVIVRKFGIRVKNLYSDTDSLILEILDPNKTLIEDLYAIREHFDFSNLKQTHPLYSILNKGVAGKLKLEYTNIREFVGLKAKVYSVLLQCSSCANGTVEQQNEICNTCYGKEQRDLKCKGVPRKLFKKMSHDLFVQTLNSTRISYIESRSIQARSCVLEVISSKRVGIHNLNVRRYILDDNINTLAFGHYRIPKSEDC